MKAARQAERRRTRMAVFYFYGLGMPLEEVGFRLGLKPEKVQKLLDKSGVTPMKKGA